MKSRLRSNRAVLVAFSSAILVLLIVGVISYRSVIISRESNRWVRHTHEVLENVENLRTAMERVQSATRAFALTGTDSLIGAFRTGARRAEQREEAVRNLTADNPVQQRRIPALQYLVTARVQRAEFIIDLRKA